MNEGEINIIKKKHKNRLIIDSESEEPQIQKKQPEIIKKQKGDNDQVEEEEEIPPAEKKVAEKKEEKSSAANNLNNKVKKQVATPEKVKITNQLDKTQQKDTKQEKPQPQQIQEEDNSENNSLFTPDSSSMKEVENLKKIILEEKEKIKQKNKQLKQEEEEKHQKQKLQKSQQKQQQRERSEKKSNHKESKASNDQQKPGATKKEKVILELLKRWQYCLPDWPPEDVDYDQLLKNNKLRKVDQKQFKQLPKYDSNNYEKVYQIEGFIGLFKNIQGQIIDLRPKDSCPCYSNFEKKDYNELKNLLIKALEKQIQILTEQIDSGLDPSDLDLVDELKSLLRKYQQTTQ